MSAAKKWRAAEIYSLIEARYPSPQYAVLPEVTNATGFDAKRRADAMVMGLWPSRGVDLHGMEIKVSRSDLRRELDNPQKAEAHAQFCDFWWIVCPAGLATVEELPEKWGLLEAVPLRRKASDGRTHHLKIRKKAVELTPLPLNRAMLASMLRRVVEYRSDATVLEDVRRKAHTSGWEDGLAHNQTSVDRITKAHEELIERVGEFEKASGLRIGARWYSHLDPGELGKAVKAIMAGDEAMRKRLEHFARLAKTMLEECEAAAKAMGTTDA